MLVVGISGSARKNSNTKTTVSTILKSAEDQGAKTDHFNLPEEEIPLMKIHEKQDTESLDRIKSRVEQADALVVGTPMYHGSYSAMIKNFLDHCGFDEIEDTDVAIAVVAGGQFPRPAVEQLRTVFSTLNARVLPRNLVVPNTSKNFTDDRGWNNDDIEERARRIGTSLYKATQKNS